MPPILINKKLGWTSQNAISYYKNHHGLKKIGHIGTLDPLATGLLVCFANENTKEINNYQGLDKEYIATFCLGLTTQSLDCEFWPEDFLLQDTPCESDLQSLFNRGKTSLQKIFDHLGIELDYENINAKSQSQDLLKSKLEPFLNKKFFGEKKQKPPIFSALKVAGQRGYKIARKSINQINSTEKNHSDIFEQSEIKANDSYETKSQNFESLKERVVTLYDLQVQNIEFWNSQNIINHYLELDQKLHSENQKWKNYSWQNSHFLDKYKKTKPGEYLFRDPQLLVFTAKIKVGSGFYVRSLARDVGEAFGTSGFLLKLKRISIESWNLD